MNGFLIQLAAEMGFPQRMLCVHLVYPKFTVELREESIKEKSKKKHGTI
jgi:hypothetical protein